MNTLAHQVSLVQHVLDNDHIRRVLIADEVGLGKTVEAGLILQQLLERSPGLRVLYLAPARLVANVAREFDRLGLSFRKWSATASDARLTDALVIASIHRAVHGSHFQSIVDAAPWDVLVVDECHHLSDWSAGGGDPKEKYRLVRDLIARQPGGSRVLFLSGTPHQGHPNRFENLLALLKAPGESDEHLAGRVIYRTKDDIRDWHGRPVFPKRVVRPPIFVDLGPAYREWIQAIHAYYKPASGTVASDSRSRAAGWRCAQALQWAASSPQAGLGYLVRQAVRAGYTLKNPAFLAALASLRPYRLGPVEEPLERLYHRLAADARPNPDRDEDDDNDAGDAGSGHDATLEALLRQGVAALATSGDDKWELLWRGVLGSAGDEKVVLFAQPIETVIALADYLERITGVRPALIIGGQSDAERDAQVKRFWRAAGPQFLVSSRAGGEGINLQVARRLVHVDVPWNPMDLEQRVGRVHRFGSRKPILVDTLVVKGSRESHAYQVARNRLAAITHIMATEEKFEPLFARVMGLLRPEELQDVLLNDATGPLSQPDELRIAALVQDGYGRWESFHARFADEHRKIRDRSAGLASWSDVRRFAETHLNAKACDGFAVRDFIDDAGETMPDPAAASVVQINETYYHCGSTTDGPVAGLDDEPVESLGLNHPMVAAVLQKLAFDPAAGAAHLRWTGNSDVGSGDFGIAAFLVQVVHADAHAGFVEGAQNLVVDIVRPLGEMREIDGEAKRELVRDLLACTVAKVGPASDHPLVECLRNHERTRAQLLRRPPDADYRRGVRHAVTPLFAAIVSSS